MKVFLDTNVLISAAFIPGLCLRIVELLVDSEDWEIVLSNEVLGEFRKHAKEKFDAPEEQVETFLLPLLQWSSIVAAVPLPADACRDPDDVPILGSAVAAKVDVLVSGDKDLLVLTVFNGIVILSPREFHDRFLIVEQSSG